MSNELELNKDRADADRYYKLFADKVGEFKDGERILFVHIGNFDVLDKFIQSNPNCSYYIIDQHLNGPWFEMSWGCEFLGSKENEEIIEKIETLNMKFDKIIMNPPYTGGKGKGNLHLRILEKAIEKLDENGFCINLSPIRWLQDPLAKYKKNSDFKKFEDSISKHITSLDQLRLNDAQKIFSARIMFDLGIYVCKSQKNTSNVYELINPLIKSIITKSISIENSFKQHLKVEEISGWRVRINEISAEPYPGNKLNILHDTLSWIFKDGYQNGKYWVDVIGAKNQYSRKLGDPLPYSFKFSSFEEAKNFEDSTKTNFIHFLNVVCKIDVAMVYLLPWMGDRINPRTGKKGYESEWTDEDFYKYFGITEDEQKLIEKTMEKYK